MGRKRKKAPPGRREVAPDDPRSDDTSSSGDAGQDAGAPSSPEGSAQPKESSSSSAAPESKGPPGSTPPKGAAGSKGAARSKGSAGAKGSASPKRVGELGELGRARPSAGTLLSGGPRGPVVAPPAAPGAVRVMLVVAAGVYLSMLLLGGARSSLPARVLPPSLLYLTQTTCLFPRAARMAIDYRVEGWDCVGRRFVELDPTPHFPIHATDKESRFQRVGHFHRRNRPVMEALERYLVGRERAAGTNIGGIRVSSLRIPFPEPGEPVARWAPAPLESYPDEQRKIWFHTPTSRRRAHCAGEDPFAGRAAPAGPAERRAEDEDEDVADERPGASGRRMRIDEIAFEDEDEGADDGPRDVRFFDSELDAIFEGTPVGPETDDDTSEPPDAPSNTAAPAPRRDEPGPRSGEPEPSEGAP